MGLNEMASKCYVLPKEPFWIYYQFQWILNATHEQERQMVYMFKKISWFLCASERMKVDMYFH